MNVVVAPHDVCVTQVLTQDANWLQCHVIELEGSFFGQVYNAVVNINMIWMTGYSMLIEGYDNIDRLTILRHASQNFFDLVTD